MFGARLIFIIGVLGLLAGQPTYGMTKAKEWVNKVRPGTFEMPDATADTDKDQGPKTFTESQLKVLTTLKQREEELKNKEEQFKQRAGELKRLSQQIEQKLDQMRILSAEIEDKRKKRKDADEKDIGRMVRYYETMAPENTAVFLNQMDRTTATHILMRMNPRKASAVMQLLEPKVAVEITENVTKFKENREELEKE